MPVTCLGGGLPLVDRPELVRLYSYPLLRRGTDLIPLAGSFGPRVPVRESHPQAERPVSPVCGPARISGDDPDLEEPAADGDRVSAVVGLVVFVWGVVWPRFVPTPEGPRFDLLVVVAFLSYTPKPQNPNTLENEIFVRANSDL